MLEQTFVQRVVGNSNGEEVNKMSEFESIILLSGAQDNGDGLYLSAVQLKLRQVGCEVQSLGLSFLLLIIDINKVRGEGGGSFVVAGVSQIYIFSLPL